MLMQKRYTNVFLFLEKEIYFVLCEMYTPQRKHVKFLNKNTSSCSDFFFHVPIIVLLEEVKYTNRI